MIPFIPKRSPEILRFYWGRLRHVTSDPGKRQGCCFPERASLASNLKGARRTSVGNRAIFRSRIYRDGQQGALFGPGIHASYCPGQQQWPEPPLRSEEPTSELQALKRISDAVFSLKKKKS